MCNTEKPIKLYGARFCPIWSGSKLSRLYDSFKDAGKVGESWEMSVDYDNPAEISVDGHRTSLRDYIKNAGLPTPPLVKLIDAAAPLSIQVHPDSAAAKKHGGISKSEIWYVLNAAPGSHILYGIIDGVSEHEVKDGILNGTIESVMRRIPVKAGDVYMIPPGMIHSLGAGVTVLEVQNCAGTTYRVKDISGNREIHQAESLDSFKLYSDDDLVTYTSNGLYRLRERPLPGEILASTEEYALTHYASKTASDRLTVNPSGVYMFCEKGAGIANSTYFTAGDSLYFPSENTLVNLEKESSVLFVI